MGALEGTRTLVMSNGTIKNRYINAPGSDLCSSAFRLLNPVGKKEEYTKFNCVVNRFDIKDGIAYSTVLVFDTNRMSVIGEVTDMRYPQSTGTAINLNTSATGGTGPLYYKYFSRLGEGEWVVIREWDVSSSGIWTPPQAGTYTVVVWVSDDTTVTNPPLAGMTCTIGE